MPDREGLHLFAISPLDFAPVSRGTPVPDGEGLQLFAINWFRDFGLVSRGTPVHRELRLCTMESGLGVAPSIFLISARHREVRLCLTESGFIVEPSVLWNSALCREVRLCLTQRGLQSVRQRFSCSRPVSRDTPVPDADGASLFRHQFS